MSGGALLPLLLLSLASAQPAKEHGPGCVVGKEARSVRKLQKAAKKDPTPGSLTLLGFCRAMAGDVEGMKADLRAAAALPSKKKSLLLAAIISRQKANAIVGRVNLDLQFERDKAAAELEHLQGAQGEPAQARRAELTEYLKKTPKLDDKERAAARDGIARARAFFEALGEARPDQLAEAKTALASINEFEGDLPSALKRLDEALAVRKDYWALLRRAGVLRQLSRPEDALADLDAAMPLAPLDMEQRVLKDRWPLLLELEKFDRLRADLDAIILKKPLEPDAYVARAQLNAEQKRWKEAASDAAEYWRLWHHLYSEILMPVAPDELVARLAEMMEEQDKAGLPPVPYALWQLNGILEDKEKE